MFLNTNLNKNDFFYFRDIIGKECGIQIPDSKYALVQARVMRRMRNLKLSDYSIYRDYLDEHYSEEIENFVNCITTNKTEFFRENHHFEYMIDHIFPEYVKSKKNKIRVWSAGCSTGQEPYTIGMVMRNYFSCMQNADVKILATDIDTGVLEKAMNGVYSIQEVEDIDEDILKHCFKKGFGENEGLFKVKDCLKSIIKFRQLNLLLDSFPMNGPFDLVFCRNVIIYFDKPSQEKLFANIHKMMHKDSYLFIGHSESLNTLSHMFKLIGRSIYRKV